MPIDLVCDSKEGLWTVRGTTSFLVYESFGPSRFRCHDSEKHGEGRYYDLC